jgi:hypothetical protein
MVESLEVAMPNNAANAKIATAKYAARLVEMIDFIGNHISTAYLTAYPGNFCQELSLVELPGRPQNRALLWALHQTAIAKITVAMPTLASPVLVACSLITMSRFVCEFCRKTSQLTIHAPSAIC